MNSPVDSQPVVPVKPSAIAAANATNTSDCDIQSRPALMLIERWIAPKARVLDLGCGNGLLLHHLTTQKNIHGYGLEINPSKITACLARGVSVIEQDLNTGLGNFHQDQFDTVIMSQTLQAVKYPAALLQDMLRVGRTGIVSFPNFGHWRIRRYLALRGQMPKSESLPYEWHNTPNIHLCTLGDFEALCRQHHFRILDKHVVDSRYASRFWHKWLPNIFGEIALYHITRSEDSENDNAPLKPPTSV